MNKLLLVLVITLCYSLDFSAQNGNRYQIKNLDSNNEYPNLGVSYFDEDFVIYSTQVSDTQLTSRSRRYRKRKDKKTKMLPQNLDFHFGTIDSDGNIVNTQKLSKTTNSEFDDKGLCFGSNQDVVYFSRENFIKNSTEKHFELFKAEVVSPGSWINIKKLPFNLAEFSITYPTLSQDGKTLYFVSNKRGNDDIYKIAILSEWGFGVPEKLTDNVNTSYDETSPFIFNDKLYFSSNKTGGLGGFDIYVVDINVENSKAQLLDSPINSVSDDICYVRNQANEGFFSSNRVGGKGKEDIYFVKDLEYVAPVLKETVNTVKANVVTPSNKVVVSEGEVAANKEVANEVAKYNSQGERILTKKVIVTSETVTKNESAYDFQRRTSYDTQVESKEVEIEYTNSTNVREGNDYAKCQIEFDKINNIFFDYSESYIREDAAVELDKLIRAMHMCPKVILRASSHTDSRASYNYNLKLSQQRSASVTKYILDNGNLPSERVIATGYGEERLINRCSDNVKCTEKEHQANRRTHFEIDNY